MSIETKLDLDSYIQNFNNFFAREKDIKIDGDINNHFKFVMNLMEVDFPTPPKIINLDNSLIKISKQAVLSLDEIFYFIKIVEYFRILKKITMPNLIFKWIETINTPEEIKNISMLLNNKGEIRADKNIDLGNIEDKIKKNKRDIINILSTTVKSSKLSSFLVDNQIHLFNGEETILVKSGYKKIIDASILGRSGAGYFYIKPQSIIKLEREQYKLLEEKDEIIYQYCKDFSNIFYEKILFLKFINKEFDKFDHYQARVKFSKIYNYNFILSNKNKRVKLVNFCHPAIKNPKPINIDFNSEIMILTGVNAGGKTVLLKSILSAIFMAKNLLPFKCDEKKSIIGHFNQIKTIIDDPQSTKDDLSTFAGRMVQFSKIFNIDKSIIVGVDEIELGTDSDEAASLFRVILKELSNKGVHFIITTHHKRLASLMSVDKNVELVAALYDEENRRPTYDFLSGTIGKSYAFETAQRYGIPSSILKEANKIYGENRDNLNSLIEKSTTLELNMKIKISNLEEKEAILENKLNSLDEEKTKLEDIYNKKFFEIKKEYSEAIKKAQDVLRVKNSNEGRKLLNDAHIKGDKFQREKKESREIFKIGDLVKYNSQKGIILSLKSKTAMVDFNSFRLEVKLEDITKVIKEKKKSLVTKTYILDSTNNSSMSIKLLGYRTDDALIELNRFLSNSILNNLNEVEIIHGHGSGILRREVSRYLKKYSKIKEFYLKNGNSGITVVKL